MARTIKDNKNVSQSYVLTTARYDLTLTEKRILYRLVEKADEVRKKSDPDFRGRTSPNVDFSLFGDAKIILNISSVLPEGSNNYNEAKKAFNSLCDKYIVFEDEKEWYKCHFLNSVRINKFTGEAVLKIEDTIWKIICNFVKGYRKYELLTAFNFRSVYSMRLYELVSNNHSILKFTIDELRKMFCLENKYKHVNDFIKRTLEVAKKELDENSPYSFNYEIIKGKYGKVTCIVITPIHLIKNVDQGVYEKELKSRLSVGQFFNEDVLRALKQQCKFKSDEIKRNRDLLILAQQTIPDFANVLSELSFKAIAGANNPQGWIIGAIKNMIDQAKK